MTVHPEVNMMRPWVSNVVLALSLLPGPLQGQERPETIFFAATTITHADLYVSPDVGVGYPATLFVALHGYGSSAEEFSRIGQVLAASGAVAALPQASHPVVLDDGSTGYDWTLVAVPDTSLQRRATELAFLEQIPQLIEELRSRFNLTKVYVLGFSQGAVVALLAGIYSPDVFDGVVTLGLPAFEPGWFPEATLEAGRDVPIWLGHGTEDTMAAPAVSRSAAEYLRAAGYSVTEHSFEGGHTVPTELLDAVVTWSRRSRVP